MPYAVNKEGSGAPLLGLAYLPIGRGSDFHLRKPLRPVRFFLLILEQAG